MIEKKHVTSLVSILPFAESPADKLNLRELAVYINTALLLWEQQQFEQALIDPTGPEGASQAEPTFDMEGANLPIGATSYCTPKAMGIAEALISLGAAVAGQANDAAIRGLSPVEIDSALNAVDEAFSRVESGDQAAQFQISTADEIALCATFAESREYLKNKEGSAEAINNSFALQDRILGSRK
jgi:hypothetical protein